MQKINVLSKFATPRESLAPECTASPLFHLQEKVYTLICTPEWLATDGDGFWLESEGDSEFMAECCEDGELIDSKVFEWLCSRDWDGIVGAVSDWSLVRTFFSRKEAEDFAEKTSYRYLMGWRVYCQPAEGELSELLEIARFGGLENAKV